MNKDTYIRIRLEKRQKDIILQRAKKANLSVSEYLRESAVNTTISKPNKDILKATTAINLIGNNLNQIAKKVNSNLYDNSETLQDALQDIECVLLMILGTLKQC